MIVIAVPSAFSRTTTPWAIVTNLIGFCKHFSQNRNRNSGHFGCAKQFDFVSWRDRSGPNGPVDDNVMSLSDIAHPHAPRVQRVVRNNRRVEVGLRRPGRVFRARTVP